MRAALVLVRHRREAIAPGVLLGKGHRPEFVRRRIGGDLAFLARLHIDRVNTLPVGGIGKAHRQLARVVLALRHPFGQLLIPRLGLNHGQLAVAVFQHVIGGERLPAPAQPLDAPRRDGKLPPDATALHDAPARRRQRGVNMLGSGFGFVHGNAPEVPMIGNPAARAFRSLEVWLRTSIITPPQTLGAAAISSTTPVWRAFFRIGRRGIWFQRRVRRAAQQSAAVRKGEEEELEFRADFPD